MNLRTGLCGLLFVAATAWGAQPTQLFYNSQTDFVEMTLMLKTADVANPRYIGVNVVLSPEAKARTAALSQEAMHKSMTVYLNGRPLTTATVRSVLDSGQMRLNIPREMLVEMMPSLMR